MPFFTLSHTVTTDRKDETPTDTSIHHGRVIAMLRSVGQFYPAIDVSTPERLNQVERFVAEAYESADLDFNIDKAVEWGDGFEITPEAHERDRDEFLAMGGDLTGMIRKRQLALQPDRLNHERLEGRDPNHPDTTRLHDLVDGLRIPVDPLFKEDRQPPPLNTKYRQAHSAVDKMWYKLYLEGFVLLIPTVTLKAHLKEGILLSYSPMGWSRKRGKRCGRSTCNFSWSNRYGTALNTKYVKAFVKAMYGDIDPVQIEELVAMVVEQAERVGWDNVVLWKMDLKGAFNLIFFLASDAGLLAMEMANGLTMISIVGSFGHTATPFGFDVVSRTILADVREGINGGAGICCDDVMGACASWEVEQDMAHTRTCIEALCGGKSVAEDKSEVTDTRGRIDFIGWSMDLKREVLGIARHNVLKTFHGFCCAQTERYLSVRTLQKLASWSTRYSLVCRYMRPFTTSIYAYSAGYGNLEAQVEVTDDLRLVISLWVMFLLLMELEPTKFNRSLHSFEAHTTTLHGNLDASLTGIGLIASRINRPRVDCAVRAAGVGTASVTLSTIAVVGHAFPFDLGGDSSYQNTAEFIAEVMLMALFTSLGFHGESVTIQGDSTTALSWASKEKFRGGRSTWASVFWIQMEGQNELPVDETEHLLGELNVDSDDLSRGVTPEELGVPAKFCFHLANNPTLIALLASFDPTVPVNLETDLKTRWAQNQVWIDILRGPGGGWTVSPWR